jgi:NADPH-dependent 2,4-dienoyl-CoA reductase/sulfur reductase-like enzyme
MPDADKPRDLIIVGAGPAGMTAAIEAAARGLTVTVLDENPAPGGRIWQALEMREVKDPDDAIGLDIIRQFRASAVDARYGAAVWSIEPDGTVFWSEAGAAHRARGAQVLLATGTTERPLPIPGWTLPGVMTIGAAQIALKTSGLVPEGAVWLAGRGPLLLLYAVQALRAGGHIAGILDLGRTDARRRALRHLPAALTAWRDMAKGIGWRREIAKAGVPWLRASNLRAQGIEALSHISFIAHGRQRTEPAELLLLHDGVMPSVQISRAIGCAHEWHDRQRCWRPITDQWGRTSLPHVLIAGDGAGIGGALAAAASGRIAALAVAYALGRIDMSARDTAALPLFGERARCLAIRPFLDTLYAPRARMLEDNTLVCRCEEVSAGDIRQAARHGCLGLNQLKAFTRCGMGPCQGRMCGPIAAQIMARARSVDVPAVEPFRPRFPVRPVTVGELAALADAALADEDGVPH